MIRTAECLTPKHPDKICDRIADAILDKCLEQDKNSRCAIEVMGGHGIITITGEITTNAWVDITNTVRAIAGDKYGVQINVAKQSPEISNGVDTGGAGDQGIMVGYACTENAGLIPNEHYLAKDLCKNLYDKFSTDGKTQITINDGLITHVVASFQGVKQSILQSYAERWLQNIDTAKGVKVLCNPAGDWHVGGFDADTGVTGRKLIVDNYGPRVPIGGGSFSGKCGSKTDRSGAYMARYIALDILRQETEKNKKHREVIVKLAYAIGVSKPVQAYAIVREEFEDGIIKERQIDLIDKYDLRPKAIIEKLELQNPIFLETAEWGAFGNIETNFPWEKTEV